MALLREVAAVAEAERATAAREIERAREQLTRLQVVESIPRGEESGLQNCRVLSQHEMGLTELRLHALHRDPPTSGRGGRGRGRNVPTSSES
jgi:hypothetical protein